jgi:hypothetical protein
LTDPRRGWASPAVALTAGVALLAAFAGISTTPAGFFISFHSPFTRIPHGEANFWLATVFLLGPAGLALGYGARGAVAKLAAAVLPRLAGVRGREAGLFGLTLFLLAAAVARLGNELVLLGLPVTDDEYAAQFGGRALAQGLARVAVPFPLDAFPRNFMYLSGAGELTSMDWLGTQAAWALATLTHSGNWVFALSAALPVPAVWWLLRRRVSDGYALLAAAVVGTAPMALALSWTTHGHLHSRGFIAVCLAAYVWHQRAKSHASGALTGLAAGLALISRPFESAALLAPLLLMEAWEALREGGARRAALFTALGAGLLPLLALLAHAHWVTGGWLPPRHSEGGTGVPSMESSLWVRFGSNSAFNLLRLGIWFAGPLGLAAAALGLFTDAFTRRLGLGFGLALALGLGHDNYGIHVVGPMHYSEAVVPLTVLAMHGLASVVRRARALGLDAWAVLGAAVGLVAVGNVGFAVVHGRALRGQAELQATVYEAIEAAVPAEARPAVVLADTFGNVWKRSAQLARQGSWVFHWRRPWPDFRDEVLILHDHPSGRAGVAAAFANRKFFRLQPDGQVVQLAPEAVTAPGEDGKDPSGRAWP